jgi:predicted membrane-bound spermidine synthase
MIDTPHVEPQRPQPAGRDGLPAVLPRVPRETRWQRAGVYAIFFVSGAASLICEVIWFKQLQLLLGSSTLAVSVVVACFFGGLAFGSWVGGRLADGWQRPLRAYAGLEFLLGLVSAGVALLLSRWPSWGPIFAPWMMPGSATTLPFIVLVSLVILLPPTALMGATLPVLARQLVRQRSQLARRIGLLYGLNTLGAATGCALVGFVLIGLIGVLSSALTASALYFAIALLALALSRRASASVAAAPTPQAAAAPVEAEKGSGVLLAVFALSGFASIAYEVLWFRILKCFSIPTVYAFSGLLSVYLLGLVLGALICARYLAPRKQHLLTFFAFVQLLTALAALFSLGLLGRGRNLLMLLSRLEPELGTQDVMSGSFAGVVPFVLLSVLVLLLPTTILGIGFPLAAELTVQRLARLGSRVGSLYGLNTLGGVLGAVLTGFVLLPWLGSYWTFAAVVGLNTSLFFLLLATQPSLRRSRSLWRMGVLGAAYILGMFVLLGKDYLKDGQTRFADAQLLAFREGRDATFALLQYDFPHTGPYQQLVANGTSYANNFPSGRRYMGVLGHLPALLHPRPRDVCVICIGTGTTVGALTLHPDVERIWAVDIAEDVFRFAPYFVPLNQRFLESPKVKPVVADGRHFLLCTEQQFDVMTFEPPPPQEAGVVNLYSREFYQLAKKRLAPGGVLCQWMPLDLSHEVLGRMMLKTLQEEFPYVSFWMPTRYEGVALASREPLPIDLTLLNTRLGEPTVRADLAAYGLGKPEQLLATFLTADDGLTGYVGDVPPVTDDRPRIEYFNFYPLGRVYVSRLLARARAVEGYCAGPLPDAEDRKRSREVMEHIWYAYELERDRKFAAALKRIEKAQELDPENPYLKYRQGGLAAKLAK